MDGWHGGWGSGWWILMPVLWIVLIAVIVWAVTHLFPGRPGGGGERRSEAYYETPKEILDRRLASGEIDIEKYDAMLAKLRSANKGGV